MPACNQHCRVVRGSSRMRFPSAYDEHDTASSGTEHEGKSEGETIRKIMTEAAPSIEN